MSRPMAHKTKIGIGVLIAVAVALLGIRLATRHPASAISLTTRTIKQKLIPGVNIVSFGYGNRNIDAESISIECIEAPGLVQIVGLEISDGSELRWRVFSADSGKGIFKVSFAASR